MKKIFEFGSKISKKGRNYYIVVPYELAPIAEKHHRKNVYVVVYAIEEEEEARAEPRSNK